MAEALEVEMSAFRDEYNKRSRPTMVIKSKLYCVPTITMRGEGSIHCFQSHDEIAWFSKG